MLDHIGSPPYLPANASLLPGWRAGMAALGAVPNFVCKVGGVLQGFKTTGAEGTAQRIAAPSLFFPGLGVGCAGVGCHAARRVVVAQEDKMITFVVREIAEESMVMSASDARQWPPDSVAPASEYWEVAGVDVSLGSTAPESQGGYCSKEPAMCV